MLFSQLLKAFFCHQYWKNTPPIVSVSTKVKIKIKAFSEMKLKTEWERKKSDDAHFFSFGTYLYQFQGKPMIFKECVTC